MEELRQVVVHYTGHCDSARDHSTPQLDEYTMVETTANTKSDYEWSLPDAAFFFTVDHAFKPITDRPDDSCTEIESSASRGLEWIVREDHFAEAIPLVARKPGAGEGRYSGREVDAAGRLSGASDHHSARGPQTGDPQVALSAR